MSGNSSSPAGGVGFAGPLLLLFIGLKLGGVIDWSWLWVLSPIWIPIGVVLAAIPIVVLSVGVVKCVYVIYDWRTSKRKLRKFGL